MLWSNQPYPHRYRELDPVSLETLRKLAPYPEEIKGELLGCVVCEAYKADHVDPVPVDQEMLMLGPMVAPRLDGF